MKKTRFLYVALLLGAAVFCILNGRWLSWFLLLTVVAAPLLSLLISLPAMRSANMKGFAPARVPIGCEASASASIQSKWLQLPFRVKLSVFQPLTGQIRLISPGDPLPTEHCGGLIIAAEEAFCCDLLGLWRHKLPQQEALRTHVMPAPVHREIPAELAHHLSFSWKPKAGGGYSEHHELREYRPGDSMNQIHWKLSAKTGEYIIREPLEPLHNRMLLTLDLRGTPAELDRKFGQLLWMGEYLLGESLKYTVLALTGDGPLEREVTASAELQDCIEALLCAPCATAGTILSHNTPAVWHCHIGGAPDEV